MRLDDGDADTSGSQHFNVAFGNRHALFAAKDL